MDDTTIYPAVVQVSKMRGNNYAYVCVAGDIDIAADVVLAAAAEQLAGLRPGTVCVDLAGVSFAGTNLLTFLVRVINSVPAGTPVLLCRPGRLTRRMLELSFLDTLATLCDDLPVALLPGVGSRSMAGSPLRPLRRR